VLEAFRHFIQGEREFAEFMPFSQLLDEDDSTELHRILTGLTPLDLEATLSNPRFRIQINTANILGLAPLHIAVMRHDAKSAQILLDYGADVNVTDSKRNTSLHLACFAGDIEIARLLLRSGALANVKNVRGRSPLVFTAAASRPTTTDLMDLLLQYGSDIEALDIYKGTPLALAAHMNSVLAVEHLIRIGANVNARDWEGDIPLTEAMRGSHCRVADILLQAGADIRNIDVHGRGVLHRLAEGGNIEMVTLLGKSGRFTEECNHPDNSGRMPMDLLDKREDVGPELRAAFRELLTSLGTGGTRESDQSRDGFVEPESDDEFHDAMEE
jgi:ankyrin repeat protein